MFSLNDDDLRRRILGCGDGPASFNAESAQRGYRIVSCDPLYQFEAKDIQSRVDATYRQIMDEARRNADDFVWDSIRSLDELGTLRMRAMQHFLRDFEAGKAQGRYVEAELPSLPFGTSEFDLALCSHLLFVYSRQLTREFHLAALDELCRVAGETRVFPLLALDGMPSPHFEPAVVHLTAQGFDVSVEKVQYEFRRGFDHMMRIRRPG
jgi:hypothetical protein